MTRHTPLTGFLGGLTAATFAAGLALAAPVANAHDGGDDGGHGGAHGHHGDPATHTRLPNGFLPEGITTGPGHTAYFGLRADGDIYALDLRSG